MREPRPGRVWSKGRVISRHCYAAWMSSPEWRARRRAWLTSWRARHQGDPCCAVCGQSWGRYGLDLHHRSYRHLGAERDDELLALCRDCHDHVHLLLERAPGWSRLGRAQATDLIVARLRAARRRGGTAQP